MTEENTPNEPEEQAKLDPLADINARMTAYVKKLVAELYPKSAPHTPKDHPDRLALLKEYKEAGEEFNTFREEAKALYESGQISQFLWNEWDKKLINIENQWFQARDIATNEPKPDLSRRDVFGQGNF